MNGEGGGSGADGINGEMAMSGAGGNNGGEAGAEGVRGVVDFIWYEDRLTGLNYFHNVIMKFWEG